MCLCGRWIQVCAHHRAFEELEGEIPLFASNILFSRHTCQPKSQIKTLPTKGDIPLPIAALQRIGKHVIHALKRPFGLSFLAALLSTESGHSENLLD